LDYYGSMPFRALDFDEYLFINHCGKNTSKRRITELVNSFTDNNNKYTFLNDNQERLVFITYLNTQVLPSHKFNVDKFRREYRIFYFLKHIQILQLYPDKFYLVFSQDGIWKKTASKIPITDSFKRDVLMNCKTIEECETELFKYGLRQQRNKIQLSSCFKKLTDSYNTSYMSAIVNEFKKELQTIFPIPIYERIMKYLLGFGQIVDT
jgi:hypothetical protein